MEKVELAIVVLVNLVCTFSDCSMVHELTFCTVESKIRMNQCVTSFDALGFIVAQPLNKIGLSI